MSPFYKMFLFLECNLRDKWSPGIEPSLLNARYLVFSMELQSVSIILKVIVNPTTQFRSRTLSHGSGATARPIATAPFRTRTYRSGLFIVLLDCDCSSNYHSHYSMQELFFLGPSRKDIRSFPFKCKTGLTSSKHKLGISLWYFFERNVVRIVLLFS